MSYYISSLIAMIIELICCKLFFEAFEKNNQKKNYFLKETLFWMLLYVGIVIIVFVTGDHIWIKIGISIIWIAVLMCNHEDISFTKSLLITTMYQSLILLSDFIVILINIGIWTDKATNTSIAQLLMTMLSKMILFSVTIKIRMKVRTKEILDLSDSDWIKFFFFPIFSIFILILIISDADIITNTKFEEISWMISVGIIAMNIFLFYFLVDISEKELIRREKERLEIETKNQLKFYRTQVKNINKQREMSHEYHNQIVCMQALFQNKEYQKLESYFQKITGINMQYNDRIDTNHTIVNALVNEKYQEAIEKEIIMVLKIGDLSSLWIEDQDIALILSNLINNAIEACEKCEKKIIKLKMNIEDTNFIIGIKNTYNGIIVKESDIIITTKKEQKELHGIGIQNVINIVESYQGCYGIDYDDNEFLFTIMISKV